MSLPTPPRTGHRTDKENRALRTGSSRVVWAAQNQYHSLSSPVRITAVRHALVDHPTKSILKQTSPLPPVSPLPETSEREETPEPSSPQSDSHYLQSPVSVIINDNSTLSELNAAYSILAARLRATVDETLNPETEWPLFGPLRDNSEKVIHAITRDVGRALEIPAPTETETTKFALPSPQKSPRKKKQGMDAEQVKHARDLCTTTHCVLKLLGFVLAQPAICGIFSGDDLRSLLTAILAIPLEDELPTLYARKTCALVIWVIQSQRLSADVLRPAADRIAYAIRRGLDGELGKEGKRGSANDGLKAIHDLCIYLPDIFVPAFAGILPSIFENLLVASAGLRIQACHALGGLAIASTTLPPSTLHEDLADSVRDFLTVNPSKRSPSKSPVCNEPRIVRSFRGTLSNEDPQNPAQSPVWTLSVLAHCILLLRSLVHDDPNVTRVVAMLFRSAKKYNRGVVRCLVGMAWRGIIWGYFQPRLCFSDEPSDDLEKRSYFATITQIVDTGCGVSILAGLFSAEQRTETHYNRAMKVLELMFQKGCRSFREALEVIRQLVNVDEEDTDGTFASNRILLPSLHSAYPGLLTEPIQNPGYANLITEVCKEGVQVNDIPPLTPDELADPTTLKRLFTHLKRAVGQFNKRDEHLLDTLASTWQTLIQAYMRIVEDGSDGVSEAFEYAVAILQEIVQEEDMTWTIKASSPTKSSPAALPRTPVSPRCLRLKVIRALWQVVHDLSSGNNFDIGNNLLASIMQHEKSLVGSGDTEAYTEWAILSARVALACHTEHLKSFWSYQVDDSIDAWKWDWSAETRRIVWGQFIDIYHQSGDSDGIVVLLGVPFSCQNAWQMTEPDLKEWEALLNRGIEKALDYGNDTIQFVDSVCEGIAQNIDPTVASATRVADIFMSHLHESIRDARSVPSSLAEFINDALRSSYPPTPKTTSSCIWTLRNLADLLPSVPDCLCLDLLDKLQEGLGIWISDESQALNHEEYSREIQALYSVVLDSFNRLPADSSTIDIFQCLLESVFQGREDKPQSIFDAFDSVWQARFTDVIPDQDWPESIRVHFGLITASPDEENSNEEESELETPTQSPIVHLGASSRSLFTPPSSPLATPSRTHNSPYTPSSLRYPESPSFASRLSSLKYAESPSRKRRISGDKENFSPVAPSSPRKRSIFDDHLDGPVFKKAKPEDVSPEAGKPQGALLFPSLPLSLSPPKVVSDIFSEPAPSPIGKRKRLIDAMDAPSSRKSRSVRRRRSLDFEDEENVHDDDEASEVEEVLLPFATMLKRDGEYNRRRRPSSSVQFPTESAQKSPELSSDDDPHIGQVTPSHLISPDLPRRKVASMLDSDPPSSDDSIPSSPVKQVVKRKKSGYTSLNGPYWAGTI